MAVVDDVHWIDQASDEVVGQFADAIEAARAISPYPICRPVGAPTPTSPPVSALSEQRSASADVRRRLATALLPPLRREHCVL
jgi:hypothetical protein